ncbi:puromycin-sensitive aminopeptidase [Galendromus occidentalis]|uniref:Aminopeptidase n=1 Tax=Galendromus occidentalis TaxID=34638 RepID=A0AAJ6QWW1_9ACAR|nr:puromycin-sensitive aminopeptidase [Galendromus occidentalis]
MSSSGIKDSSTPMDESQSAISSALSDHKPQFQRLPKNIVPESYNITLKTDLEEFIFQGSIKVTVKVLEASRTLKLDSDQLNVSNAELAIVSSGKVLKPEIKILPDEERLLFVFDEEIPIGDAVFSCEFRGILGDKLRGLYRSKSKNAKGEDAYFAVTQFEPMDAHRAFPCWDEPAIKATFNLTLIVRKDKLALSNMLPIDEQPLPEDNEWKVVRFQTTPKMSTYLVAVVVGEYDYVEGITQSKIRVRAYVPLGKKEQGRYALDTAVKALDFFEKYYNVSYPLPKADLVSIADFEAGAMENWGLITCRETLILYDPTHTSTIRKQTIAAIISHELAHMWFGNLVTMQWWTDLWLNEGFARFMENLATHALFPEYDIWTQFVSEGLNQALGLDALDSSHPIEVPIEHPAVVDEIFDLISYEKGASIIRMLNNYIGDKKFRAGMQLYLSQNKYKNTFTSDLWRALEEASSVPVQSIMDTWVKQMGFPLISVKSRKDGANVILTLSQEKFYSWAETPQRKKSQPIWKVPIDIATSKNQLKQILLETPTQEIIVENASDADWIHVNHGAVSPFRTLYETDRLQAFLPAIKDLKLSAVDRYMLHADISACVQSGYRNSTEVLQLTRAYENETDFSVWTSIASLFEKLNVLLSEREDLQLKLHEFGRGLYRKIYEKLGWDPKTDDVHTTMLLRVQVLTMLVTFGDKEVLGEARRRFADHVSKKKILMADIRQPVYRAMAKTMNSETWVRMMKLHKETTLKEEANRIANSLGHVVDEYYIQKVIQFADTEVRIQDAPFVISSVASTALGRNKVWEHYTTNFEMYKTNYASGHLLTRLIKGVTEDFSSFEKAKEVENFFATKNIPGAELTVRQSIENIISNARWLQRDEQLIKEFFSKLN